MMKKLILLLSLSFMVPSVIFAAGAGAHLESADADIGNKESLQRGVKYYVNYCMGCHSLEYSRYNRVGKDLNISDDDVMDNLVFTTDEKGEKSKVGSLMTIPMTVSYGRAAFGTPPPDLTVISRSRNADWIYTYLKGFYVDESRPFGVNNIVFPDVGMPHVLGDLQGWLKNTKTNLAAGDHHVPSLDDLEMATPGTMNAEQYDQVVKDITNFLVYVGEPSQIARKRLGPFVLLFLGLFVVLTYLLKKEYWKDVH